MVRTAPTLFRCLCLCSCAIGASWKDSPEGFSLLDTSAEEHLLREEKVRWQELVLSARCQVGRCRPRGVVGRWMLRELGRGQLQRMDWSRTCYSFTYEEELDDDKSEFLADEELATALPTTAGCDNGEPPAFAWKFTRKCRTLIPGPAFCMEIYWKNACGHCTRAILCEIYRKNAGPPAAHLDQAPVTVTVRTPSVWPHCLGIKSLLFPVKRWGLKLLPAAVGS